MAETPRIIMFAGPNGSGKSTVTARLRQHPGFPENYANADDIAKTLGGDAMLDSYEAARMVEHQRLTWVNSRQSFAFETVMSHPSKLLQLLQAKMLGYQIDIYYVATDDPRNNVLRVMNRVMDGGHDVPVQKILERYDRSLKLLPLAIEVSTAISLIDNTNYPIEIAKGGDGLIYPIIDACPGWGMRAITQVHERQVSRQALYSSFSNGNPLITADAWAGRYSGAILSIDNHYLVQACEIGMILHDRLLVNGDFQIRQYINISYQEGTGSSAATT
jgi:predicted ABC-type ATPase